MSHISKQVTHSVSHSLLLLGLLLFFLGPLLVQDAQAYSVGDYDPQYTPYNFVEAEDARLCRDVVEAFDSDYDALTKSYTENLTEVILSSGVQGSLSNVNSWLEANEFYYSNMFRECIAEDLEKEEAEAKQRARERFEQEQSEKLQKAINDCDMDYLEALSDSEKMATYDDRMACKDQLATEAIQASETAHEPVTTPVYVPPVTTTVPEPVTYTAPVVPKPADSSPVAKEEQGSDRSAEVSEEVQATSSASTTEENIIEMTEEDLQRMVEQRVNDALKETQAEVTTTPEPEKPTFFKKVINFLFGWW